MFSNQIKLNLKSIKDIWENQSLEVKTHSKQPKDKRGTHKGI